VAVGEWERHRFNGFLPCPAQHAFAILRHVSAFLFSGLVAPWGRGYGAFSVSHSGTGEVARYIADQEEHHLKRSFAEELKLFVERYELQWHEDGNR
jgi:hypothetical protein